MSVILNVCFHLISSWIVCISPSRLTCTYLIAGFLSISICLSVISEAFVDISILKPRSEA
ncbi:TPA: hypothetical protein DEG21_02605 [Patescibacteria group bacterium]|nr:hypothetical protein [Candidatus Gracilibacteria bacterium]HBY74766.1 hypothetical protein [Candidatus Gracilibacteria bacterium]